jgi:hypothetical protein
VHYFSDGRVFPAPANVVLDNNPVGEPWFGDDSLQVEVQMFQLYRDGLDDLLKETKKPAKGEEEKKPAPLKITLAEHSPTGLVLVRKPRCILCARLCCELPICFFLYCSGGGCANADRNHSR